MPDVKPTFLPTLDKIGRLISDMEGIVQVTGHTDNVPISNARFRSNWELSAGRAVSVVHRLLDGSSLDPRRIVVTGLASTQPRVPNDSAENRARNRRVEISLVRPSSRPQPTAHRATPVPIRRTVEYDV